MTIEDFAQLQISETGDFELVEGELIPLSSKTPRHSRVRDAILFHLYGYFRKSPIGEAIAEVDCRFTATVRRAEVSVFLSNRVQIDPGTIPVAAPSRASRILPWECSRSQRPPSCPASPFRSLNCYGSVVN